MKFIHKVRPIFRDEHGQTIIMTALMLAVLLGLVALVVDGGTLYATKSHLQKTANAAVLSSAQELTGTEKEVKDIIDRILAEHKEGGSLKSSKIELGNKVTVELKREVPLGFARVLGFKSAPVAVKAAAEILTMGSAVGVVPIGIDESIHLEYNVEYKLKVGAGESTEGNFGASALGGRGSTYGLNLKYGYKSEIKVGDVIDTEPGNIAGDTRDGVNYRINHCPYPDGDLSHRDCARIVLVPVYKLLSDKGGRKEVEITGFAYFYITKPMSDKSTSITGMFIEHTGTGFFKPGAENKGAYAIRLTE